MKIAKYIVYGLACFGILMLMIISHELVHKWDFRNVAENATACVFILPTEGLHSSAGTYSFMINPEKSGETARINEFTEIHAYAVTVIVLFLFGTILIYDFYKRQYQEIESEMIKKYKGGI
jgi:hypothetical protein